MQITHLASQSKQNNSKETSIVTSKQAKDVIEKYESVKEGHKQTKQTVKAII